MQGIETKREKVDLIEETRDPRKQQYFPLIPFIRINSIDLKNVPNEDVVQNFYICAIGIMIYIEYGVSNKKSF